MWIGSCSHENRIDQLGGPKPNEEESLNLIEEKKRSQLRKLKETIKEIGNNPKESGKLREENVLKRECL